MNVFGGSSARSRNLPACSLCKLSAKVETRSRGLTDLERSDLFPFVTGLPLITRSCQEFAACKTLFVDVLMAGKVASAVHPCFRPLQNTQLVHFLLLYNRARHLISWAVQFSQGCSRLSAWFSNWKEKNSPDRRTRQGGLAQPHPCLSEADHRPRSVCA
jgi:hypothetical protein